MPQDSEVSAVQPAERFAYRTIRRYRTGVPVTVSVTCECGEQHREVYPWSWAGHGAFTCRGCGKHVPFNDYLQGEPAPARERPRRARRKRERA